MRHLVLGFCCVFASVAPLSAEIVKLTGPEGDVYAVINTEHMQFAVAADETLIVQFTGGEESRLTVSAGGDDSEEVLRGWLKEISEVAD